MNYIKPTQLLPWNRWDIIIKYHYVYIYLLYLGKPPKWIIELYNDHILVLNGGYEEKTVFQSESKNSVEQFITDFDKLIENIKNNGFNIQYPIPITHKGTILNGGHRIAISLALDLNIPIHTINDNISLSFPSFGFQNRDKYEHIMPKIKNTSAKTSLMEWQNDLVALNLIITQPNYRIIVFFDNDNYKTHKKDIHTFLQDNKTNIVYVKSIILSQSGIYKLTQHLYHTEKHVNVNWKTNQIYPAKKNKYKSTIMIIHSKDNKIIDFLSKSGGQLKSDMRQIIGGHHKLHITDNDFDTKMIGKLVFHQPSIDFINIASVNNSNTMITQLNSYKNYIQGIYKIYNKLNESRQDTILNQSLEQFQDMFCVSSSYILALYGIRKNLDVDFIYDNTFLPVVLNDKIFNVSHNKYSSNYPQSIKNLIHDPNNYFYFLGVKCLKLDIIKQMKIKRYEQPKDVSDIQLIQEYQKFSHLKHLVTIITVTHILPSAPSIEIIQKMLNSLHQNVEGAKYLTHMIFVDSCPSNPNNDTYINNLLELKDQYNNLYIINIPNSGLKSNYINGIKLTNTPYLYFIEHDWIFNEVIPTDRFVNIMQKYSDVNYIKLSKRDNEETGGWDKTLTVDNRFDDLIKTDSWTNHPHIVRKDKWVKDWINIINPNQKNEKSYGVEEVLYKHYQADINKTNFDKAHRKWGCYNWLSITGKSPIKHIDGSLHYIGNELDGFQS